MKPPEPRKGERRERPSLPGKVTCLGVVAGYVVARCPGASPFLVSAKEWQSWPMWRPGETKP